MGQAHGVRGRARLTGAWGLGAAQGPRTGLSHPLLLASHGGRGRPQARIRPALPLPRNPAERPVTRTPRAPLRPQPPPAPGPRTRRPSTAPDGGAGRARLHGPAAPAAPPVSTAGVGGPGTAQPPLRLAGVSEEWGGVFTWGVRAPGSAGLCVAVLTWAPGNDRDSGEGGGRASLLQGLKTPQPFRPHRGPLSCARPPFADGAVGARGAGQRGPVTVVAPGSKPAARLRACAPAPRPPAPRQHGVRRGPAGLALRPHHTAASPSLVGSAARGAHTPPWDSASRPDGRRTGRDSAPGPSGDSDASATG